MCFYLIIQHFLSNPVVIEVQRSTYINLDFYQERSHVLFSISESSYRTLQYDCLTNFDRQILHNELST